MSGPPWPSVPAVFLVSHVRPHVAPLPLSLHHGWKVASPIGRLGHQKAPGLKVRLARRLRSVSVVARSEAPIHVRSLSKVFRVHEREEGLVATVRSLFARRFREVAAVQDVSFEVAEGEIVGFLGPNGAGKTTTLKMLSGLLYPTSGEVRVLGHVPWKREAELLSAITLVMGNRSQLIWDIPAADSLRVLQEIFRIPEVHYQRSLSELVDLLELEPLLHKPVRNLSLGERMKVEFAAALIHEPRILFLDEPTIGLDVTMQGRIRHFVAEYNRRSGATILLTSHYMDDVVALC